SINVIVVGRFYTSSPYNPSGDQGYGWMVPAYSPEGDADGVDIDLGDEIMLFEFDITVVDLDSTPVEGVTVKLYFTNGTLWEDDNGLNRVDTTDSSGLVVFEGLNNDTYTIRSEIDAAAWLSTSYSNIWIKDSSNHDITGSVTPVQITLEMASIDIHLEDLMGDSMADNDDEDTNLRLNNGTLSSSDYVAQAKTNPTGWIHFHRVPQDDYDVYARYAGSLGWSYGYDDINLFAGWSIASSEFNSGSFSHSDWIMPLITLDIHVLSWDNQDVEGASVKINNSIDENAYSITKTSNADGDYSFYRIVNGTWNLDVWKDDDYSDTPLARNNTVSLANLQGYTQKDMEIPITQLIVRVQTGPTTYVEGAQVNVTLKGFGLIAQGVTNSTGHVTFFYIHGNLSNPYYVAYNLTVQSGNQVNGTPNELLAKCDYDWTYVNVILLPTPTYSADYTELNSTVYFVNVRWGRNASFVVGFFDRDGDGSSTSAISFGASSWLNFTIYYDGQAIGWGTWNMSGYDWVNKTSAINCNITIDSDHWLMNVSETTYQVIISGNSILDPPAPITVYITVLAAETQSGYETIVISEEYKTHSSHLFWLHDDTNDVNVTDMDVFTYTVKFGTTVLRTGSLTDNLDGTYSFPASALHNLDIGNYIVIISLEKINYVNRSLTADAAISELPMSLTIFDPGDYDWSLGSESIDFDYLINSNSTNPELSGVSVTIEWIDHDTQVVYLVYATVLDASPTHLTYTYTGDIVPVGTWDVRITCKKTNYGEIIDTLTVIIVSEAQTSLAPVAPGPVTVDWSEDAVFQVDYIRTGDAVGLEGASFTHNWTGTVILEYISAVAGQLA
ncbi:MAG: prealbumin-like fold domain-containing protein, partial [Candidatus Thorarchaeota archaeon]